MIPKLRIFDGPSVAQDTNPSKKRRRRRLPNFLTAEQIDVLLAVCDSQILAMSQPWSNGKLRAASKLRAAQRDKIIVLLGMFCGLRVSEISALQVRHLNFADLTLFVELGKGAKDRYVSFPSRIADELRQACGDRSGNVLLNERGGPLTTPVIEWRVERLGSLCGFARNLCPHDLRHTFATRLLETGATIAEVSALLGHQDVATTSIYLHCDVRRLRAAVERL